MKWLPYAPVFWILALGAGALAALSPDSRIMGLVAMGGFGIAALAGWFETNRQIEKAQAEKAALEGEIESLESQVVRHRDALDDLAEGIDASIFLLDPGLKILYFNSLADEFFRIGDREGEPLGSVTLSNELAELAEAVVQTGKPQEREVALHHPRQRIVQARCWAEEYGEDRLFLKLRDVTELRHLETVRRDFVANVSHELRTPMTTIRAMAETLEEPDCDEDLQKKYLDRIIREIDRLTRITDDLLTLSIAESGTVQRTKCDFAEIVGTVAQQLEKKAAAKGLAMETDRPKSLSLFANETQLAQIAFNLIDNAINYTVEGKVTVHLADVGGQAVLTVSDTGIGISSEHLNRIFERFYRVDKGRSRASGGTGLGLAIVKHLAELHGGTVKVESLLNRGSTFSVLLPLPKGDTHPPL